MTEAREYRHAREQTRESRIRVRPYQAQSIASVDRRKSRPCSAKTNREKPSAVVLWLAAPPIKSNAQNIDAVVFFLSTQAMHKTSALNGTRPREW